MCVLLYAVFISLLASTTLPLCRERRRQAHNRTSALITTTVLRKPEIYWARGSLGIILFNVLIHSNIPYTPNPVDVCICHQKMSHLTQLSQISLAGAIIGIIWYECSTIVGTHITTTHNQHQLHEYGNNNQHEGYRCFHHKTCSGQSKS
jgi:hypothetical protein